MSYQLCLSAVPRIGSGAYTAVREDLNARDNAAIGLRWDFETTFRDFRLDLDDIIEAEILDIL